MRVGQPNRPTAGGCTALRPALGGNAVSPLWLSRCTVHGRLSVLPERADFHCSYDGLLEAASGWERDSHDVRASVVEPENLLQTDQVWILGFRQFFWFRSRGGVQQYGSQSQQVIHEAI
jgi:hypothetical protein